MPSSEEPESPGGSEADNLDERLDDLDRRLSRIEQKLDRVTELIDRAPSLVATATDVADEYARRAEKQGASVDERVNALAPVLLRLSEPEVLETLELLLERTDRIEQTVEMLDTLEGTAATVGDVVDSYAMQLDERGAGVDERLRAFGKLVVRATEPEVLETLHMIVERNDSLRQAVEMVDQMPGTVATVVDTFDELVMEASEHGIDVVQVTQGMAEAAEELAQFIQGHEFQHLMESGVLDPEAVRVIGKIAGSMAEASSEEAETSGFFDLFRAMRRSNVKRAVNFMLRIGEHFGEALGEEDFEPDRARLPNGEPKSSALPET